MDAVILHEPRVACLPLVLDSPHSGEHYPDDFDYAPPLALVRQAEDTHVARLWRGALDYGATLIEATFPRAYIDANRSLDDVDPDLLDDEWPAPVVRSRKTELGVGLVWRLAHGGVPMYARRLRAAEVRQRIERCWRPYHERLASTLDERHRAFGSAWHVNCHSMQSVGDALSDDVGRARADFVLGDRDGTTCDAAFTGFVASTLRSLGYGVAINDPYKGVELVRVHGRPHERRHSLQVEINRRLYMDQRTLVPHDGYRRLEHDLRRLAAALARFVRERIDAPAGRA
jgi:N-formylglutamate amidohydrolase